MQRNGERADKQLVLCIDCRIKVLGEFGLLPLKMQLQSKSRKRIQRLLIFGGGAAQ